MHCVDCREAKCEIIKAIFHHFNLSTKNAEKGTQIEIVQGGKGAALSGYLFRLDMVYKIFAYLATLNRYKGSGMVL